MDLRALRYFIAVLEAGSLSRAAGSLHIAQPALTAQIKKLEGELGAQLFERSHAGVIPTPAGLQLYQDAQRLLSDAAAMRERVQRLPQGPEGSVTVAVPFLLALLLMGPVLARLKESHPRVRVFVLDDLSLLVRKAMVDRRADVGILVDSPQAEGLRCEPFVRECMYFCGHDASGEVRPLLKTARGHAAALPDIDFADAASQPLVLQSQRYAIRRAVEQAAATRGVALNLAHEHDSDRVIRSLNRHGAGYTFIPACSLTESASRGSDWLVARVVRPELTRTYSLATADRPLDAAAHVVVEALRREAKRLIDERRWLAAWTGG